MMNEFKAFDLKPFFADLNYMLWHIKNYEKKLSDMIIDGHVKNVKEFNRILMHRERDQEKYLTMVNTLDAIINKLNGDEYCFIDYDENNHHFLHWVED